MNAQQARLYERILSFPFDESGVVRTFASRLAEEHGWSAAFASRAILEYRRFLLLTIAAGHVVCPSEEVDEVWHLHLQYSRSYWEKLCGEVLGKPLHHEPSRGGAAESAKHLGMYRDTLASYRRIFGEPAPADLWPAPAARFAPRALAKKVDRQRYWVIPKPALRFSGLLPGRILKRGLTAVLLGVLPLPLLGAIDNPWNLKGPDFLQLYIPVLLSAFVLAYLIRRWAQHQSPPPQVSNEELDAYEMAFLAGGKRRAMNTAIARLVDKEVLKLVTESPPRLRRSSALPSDAHELERIAYESFPDSDEGALLKSAHAIAATALSPMREKLCNLGLIVSPQNNRLGLGLALFTMAMALAFGVSKIVVGVQRDRPVAFLVLICIAAAIASLVMFARPLHRTSLGKSQLRTLQQHFASLRSGNDLRKTERRSDPALDWQLATAVGLFGYSLLADTSLAGYERAMRNTTGASMGSGGGCGGGGCGGGGCGGCGS